MNELKIFENEILGELNVLYSEEHGPLFVGHEVAEMSGYKKPRDAIQNLKDKFKIKFNYEDTKELFSKSKILDTKINSNGLIMVNEAGLYKLASGKNEEFENWIFFEVLPAIRKTGNYQVESQNNRLIQNLMINLEQAFGIKREELAILQGETPNKRLSNLMIDCSRNGMGSMKELYDELFYVLDAETGIKINEYAKSKKVKRMDYLKTNKELCETVYKFAYNHFTRSDRQIMLVPWDNNQRSLSEYGMN